MKNILLCFLMAFMLSGCLKHEMPNYNVPEPTINENVEKVFGVTFDPDHDWCSTVNSKVTISNVPSDTKCVKLMGYVREDDDQTSLVVLNETNPEASIVTLNYDAPKDLISLYALFELNDGTSVFRKIEESAKAMTRGLGFDALPAGVERVSGGEYSFASERGWLPGQYLYWTTIHPITVQDYDDGYKDVFRAVIFSYFKNGRKYNNLPLVKQSGYYNISAYPITTGNDPIILSPVYKNDGGYKEVVNSDLYYYYFKEEDITPGDTVAFLNALPKFKVIQFSDCIKGDDEICKHMSYPLVYFGDGTPYTNTAGSFKFPPGYKIGFMVRAKTTAENGKKQGELYGDGRLNNDINNYSACNFKSSKLGQDGPRIAWMTVNSRTLMCWESGTDSDFNDIIIEVEGGVEPIITIPEPVSNYYTFCFEDSPIGDYDMNDIVIKARRIDETHVEYTIVACGAFDELFIKNIFGNIINDNAEVHTMFGYTPQFYINTLKGSDLGTVTETITVDKDFSFLDEATQPYIYDLTYNRNIYLSKKGQDPHGIMIPCDFKYPTEKTCIKTAYPTFNSWGSNRYTATDWYRYPSEGFVF